MGDGRHGDDKRRVVTDWAAEEVIGLSCWIFLVAIWSVLLLSACRTRSCNRHGDIGTKGESLTNMCDPAALSQTTGQSCRKSEARLKGKVIEYGPDRVLCKVMRMRQVSSISNLLSLYSYSDSNQALRGFLCNTRIRTSRFQSDHPPISQRLHFRRENLKSPLLKSFRV